MKHGFIKVAAVTPKIKVADPKYNAGEICKKIDEAIAEGAKLIVFPELCIPGIVSDRIYLRGFVFAGTFIGAGKRGTFEHCSLYTG